MAQAFHNQFKKPQHRYKFLVVSGPSRVGKTASARSLCEPGLQTSELNCSSGAEPDLKAYRFRRHGLILHDEIEAEQVAAQRKLSTGAGDTSAAGLQRDEVPQLRGLRVEEVGPRPQQLAPLLELECAPERDWLRANSIGVDVVDSMWHE